MKLSVLACVACIMVAACGGVDAVDDPELGTSQAAVMQWSPLVISAPSGSSLCGNGKLDFGEGCDGYNFGGENCASLGYDFGSLKCNACTINTSGCSDAPLSPTECGNGKVESGEQCDGPVSGTCQGYGYDSGTLACVNCKYDFSGCDRAALPSPSASTCLSQVTGPTCSDTSCKNCCQTLYSGDGVRKQFCQMGCVAVRSQCVQSQNARPLL